MVANDKKHNGNSQRTEVAFHFIAQIDSSAISFSSIFTSNICHRANLSTIYFESKDDCYVQQKRSNDVEK